jgi:hypothetical protein
MRAVTLGLDMRERLRIIRGMTTTGAKIEALHDALVAGGPLATNFERVAAVADFGTPTARKTGRNPRWPYVPVLIVNGRQQQILGYAYATRDGAIASAVDHIVYARADLAVKLADPRYRALREQYGLPREIGR